MTNTTDPKLNALLNALYPLLRQRLEEDYALTSRVRQRARSTEKVYIPEIDYLIALYRLRGEVKSARVIDGRLVTQKNSAIKGQTYYCTGASGTSPNGDWVDEIYIPTQTLLQLNRLHGIDVRNDYRLGRATTYYSGYITDAKGELIKGSASCYPLKLTTPLTQDIIDATTAEWSELTEEDKAKRLVHWTHLQETMEVLSDGRLRPDQQVDMWRVLMDDRGHSLSYEEAEDLSDFSDTRLHPRKIAPTWMQNDT